MKRSISKQANLVFQYDVQAALYHQLDIVQWTMPFQSSSVLAASSA